MSRPSNAVPSTVKSIAVLDRTKEPGATGEPLYQDVVTAVMESWSDAPASMVRCPRSSRPLRIVLEGIHAGDGQSGFRGVERRQAQEAVHGGDHRRRDAPEPEVGPGLPHGKVGHVNCSIFYGLGSDGTVGANKNTVKIIGENTNLFAQGYFVYDSKKAGAMTVSHLRFSPRPINSTYLIDRARFVACHQPVFLERMDVLEKAEQGATFLLNTPYGPDESGTTCRRTAAVDHRQAS
jgi:pyruvate-ferredoxin/flavodoxin oxidoreductase